MKAIRIHKHGGIKELNLEDIEIPKVLPNEVLINVKGCALNYLDIWVRKGMPGITIPLPHTPGCDVSGVVSEVGPGVRHVKAGESVIVCPGVSCGLCKACLSGEDYICPAYTLVGYTIHGGYAEYVKVPAVNVIPKPNNLNFIEAASVSLVFMTVWHMLVGRAKVKTGEDVLVLASGGGVGTASVQVAKLLGAKVIAIAGSDEKLKKIKELGADHLINHSKTDFLGEVKRITNKKGVEVVVDTVGSETFEKGFMCLARNGRLVTCGASAGHTTKLDLRYLFAKHLTLYGSYMGSKGELLEVLSFIKAGKLKPIIGAVLPLDKAAQGHELLESRKVFGKVVLSVS